MARPHKRTSYASEHGDSTVGGGFEYFFIFTPKIGEDFQLDSWTIIFFQMGWNYQAVIDLVRESLPQGDITRGVIEVKVTCVVFWDWSQVITVFVW